MSKFLCVCLCIFAYFAIAVNCATPEQWKSRTIYQIITDRFAQGSGKSLSSLPSNTNNNNNNNNNNHTLRDPSPPQCALNEDYCGGNFQGIISQLDYIQSMNFDAIWISPIVANMPTCYHGYAAQNIYEINPYFGTEQDFIDLISECHARDIWVMVDVVGNHMGIPPNYDFSQLYPFNQSQYFHDCNSCPQYCSIQDFTNQPQVETCRLDGLPDLNQTNEFVATTLTSWINNLVSKYNIDGLRVDTVAEVHPDFWTKFQAAAGVYAVGEVFNGDAHYVAPYQQYIDATLSYPMYFTMLNVFARQQSFTQLQSQIQTDNSMFKDVSILGVFIDNHDNPRFLSYTSDYKLYQAALAYVLMSTGIPIIYYGTEQGYSGSDTPHNRLPLWLSGFATNNPLYSYIAAINKCRQDQQIYQYPQQERVVTNEFYSFTRGQVFVAVTNAGSSASQQVYQINNHPYQDNTLLCNIFYATDCVTVTNGVFNVYLNHGESKIFVPSK